MITLIVVLIAENYYIWTRDVIITQATFMFYFSMNFRQWIFWLQCCFCMQKRKRLFGFWLLYVNECYLIILIVESLVKKKHTHMYTYTNTYFFSKDFIGLLSIQLPVKWKNWSIKFLKCIKCKQYQDTTFTDMLKRWASCTRHMIGKIA